MIDPVELQRRARRKMRGIERRRKDSRYQQVLGRFVAEGLLDTNQPVRLHKEPIEVNDVLWAGQVEPRFLELIPALLVKQPSMFVNTRELPGDLASAVRALRRNSEPETFRGIPGRKLLRWLGEVGPRRGVPARLKSFRLRPDDLRLLSALAERLDVSETEVVRRGLRALL